MTATVHSATLSHDEQRRPRLPLVVYVLAMGTFLMLTTEFVVAGILLQVSNDLDISASDASSLITVFAIGMIVGAPAMTLLTLRMSKRLTLLLALAVFIGGHVVVALSADLTLLLTARFVTAIATGAFWAVAAVVATRAAGPGFGARAMGIVSAGGALATVLGVPLGAFLAQLVGWRGTFWALAIAAAVTTVVVARLVAQDAPGGSEGSVGDELRGLLSGRLALALLGAAATTGGVLAAYSFIAPVLTEQAGVPEALVPLVLTAFGVGSFIGTILGGRYGDAHPGAVTILVPAATVLLLLGIASVTGAPWLMTLLVVGLGLFGLSANGVLIHLAVRYAGGSGLGSALQVAAFNAGTAIGTAVGATILAGPLGTQGTTLLGAGFVALAILPATALAVIRHRRVAAGLDAD